MSLRLTPFGAADTVTGSNFLIEGDHGKILVDCGIEQGRDFCESCTYAPFEYDVPSIDALVITHAHLDHIGRAPKLMREGFKGKVYMTPPTRDIMELILRDSVRILADEAERHHLQPLYDDRDIDALLARVELLSYHEERKVAPGLSMYFRNTGHILGSASVRIRSDDGTSIALTGDIGNSPNPYLPDPEPITDADVILMESVYGDRLHPSVDRVVELRTAITRAVERAGGTGTILMPAFSIERTQLLLYELSNFMDAGLIPKIPVFLDSPLAIKVTEVYEKWGEEYFKPAAKEELHREHDLFKFPFLTMTLSREESQKIQEVKGPKIIMAGAGMSHGGRIGRWEQLYLPDPASSLFIVGYQAPGSPGRMLQDGAPSVRLNGQDVRVRAKIDTYSGWSAHADRDGLLKFAEGCLSSEASAKEGFPRTKTFFTALGEPSAERFLAQRIHDFLGVKAIVPTKGETWEITKEGATKIKA